MCFCVGVAFVIVHFCVPVYVCASMCRDIGGDWENWVDE